MEHHEAVRVTVAPLLHRIALACAHWRDIQCIRGGILDQKYGTGYVQGRSYVYELAVADYFNVFPNLVAEKTANPVDLIINGWTVDVKGKVGWGDVLEVVKHNKAYADIFVLITGRWSPYRLVGWAWKEDVFRCETFENHRGQTMFRMQQFDLNPIIDFPRYTKGTKDDTSN